MIDPKVLKFALLGACGCLAAWVLGEGWLAATQTQTAGPSLASKPEPPKPPTAPSDRPPPPAIAKELPPPPKPLALSGEWEKRLKGTGTGDVRFSLSWNNRNDLDLHCIDPNGDEIWFKPENRKSRSGGWLDRDANNGDPKAEWGDRDDPIENIFWPTGGAPVGEYKVWVHHYPKRGTGAPTPFEVRVEIDGVKEDFKGNIAKDEKSKVHTFHVKRELVLAVPDAVVVDQGGKNTLGVQIGRKRLAGEAKIRFVDGGKGLTLTEKTVGASEKKTEIEVVAAADAPPGERFIEAIAVCDGVEARSRFKVDVRRIPPSLQLSASNAVEVDAGGTNKLTFLVVRHRFAGPIELALSGAAKGLTLTPTSIGDGQSEAEITLTADPGAELGKRAIVLEATGAEGKEAKATTGIDLNVRPSSKPGWSWFEVLRIACWTGLLAAGLATALACGQNYYLDRPIIGPGLVPIVGGSFAAGAVAGALGQSLFAGLASASLEPMIGFVVGWLLLGALLGRGVGFFIPNLGGGKASMAGAVGGLAGGLAFLAISYVGGALPGRLIGAALLGASIGAMVAIAERVFRKVWLEVRRGPNEAITVNLGPEPVKVGAAPGCTVFVAGATTVLRYWVRDGKVLCEAGTEAATEEPIGRARSLGSVALTVHSAKESPASSPAQPKAVAPGALPTPGALPFAPAKPVQVARPRDLSSPLGGDPGIGPAKPVQVTRPRDPDGCPKCGQTAPGPKGLRFCSNCECKF